jgi:hypothetical protein
VHILSQEYAERLEITYQRELEQARKDRRQAIGAEKRKWKIRFYTREGKPDQKRRPDRAWHPSGDFSLNDVLHFMLGRLLSRCRNFTVLAGPEKSVYSAGVGVNLMANLQAEERKAKGKKRCPCFQQDSVDETRMFAGLKDSGSEESVESTMAQYALQTYLDQVRTYQTMLRPIENIMKRTLGAAPDDVNTQHNFGYGDMGPELPHALGEMGAVPKDWSTIYTDAHLDGSSSSSSASIVRGRRVHENVREMIKERAAREKIRSKSREANELRTRRRQEEEDQRRQFFSSSVASSFTDIDGEFSHTSSGHLTAAVDGSTERASSPRHQLHLAPVRVAGAAAGAASTTARRKANRQPKPRMSAVIPWALLDELEGEKNRFANERSFFEYSNKFMQKP